METKKYCAYNKNQASYLNLRITVLGEEDEPLGGETDGAARNGESALWLNPFRDVSAMDGLRAYDLVYLDENYRVVKVFASSSEANSELPQVTAASALALPPNAISASQTRCGDELLIWANEMTAPAPGRKRKSLGTTRVQREKEPAAAKASPAQSASDTARESKRADKLQSANERSKPKKEAEPEASEKSSLMTHLKTWGSEKKSRREKDLPISILPTAMAPAVDAPARTKLAPVAPVSATPAASTLSQGSAVVAEKASSQPEPAPVSVNKFAEQPPPFSERLDNKPESTSKSEQPVKPSTKFKTWASAIAESQSESLIRPVVPTQSSADVIPSATATLTPAAPRTARLSQDTPVVKQAPAQDFPVPSPVAKVEKQAVAASERLDLKPKATIKPDEQVPLKTQFPTRTSAVQETPSESLPASAVPAVLHEPSPAAVSPAPVTPVPKAPAASTQSQETVVARQAPAPSASVASQSKDTAPQPQPAARRLDETSKAAVDSEEHAALQTKFKVWASAMSEHKSANPAKPIQNAPVDPGPSISGLLRRTKDAVAVKRQRADRSAGAAAAVEAASKRQVSTEQANDKKKAAAQNAKKASLKASFIRWLNGMPKPAERYRLPGLVAYYWTGGASQPHSVGNISASGMYLLTKERWMPDTVLLMHLQTVPAQSEEPAESIPVLSKVIWQDDKGVGLQFVTRDLKNVDPGQMLPPIRTNRVAIVRFLQRVRQSLAAGAA